MPCRCMFTPVLCANVFLACKVEGAPDGGSALEDLSFRAAASFDELFKQGTKLNRLQPLLDCVLTNHHLLGSGGALVGDDIRFGDIAPNAWERESERTGCELGTGG